MRTSQFFITTQKETPAEAELVSHQLMLRAGLIKRLASGLYSWLPLGLKTLRKVEAIVREEMNKAGALELLMPAVQPAELWRESGRWQQYGPELLRLKDRNARDYCVGPTHEEVITDIIRNEIVSYKHLPLNLYQIQTKFRDEIRPRFGVMRSREFVMKDGYSFHLTQASLQATYDAMHTAYTNIFTRLTLEFRAVKADSGSIGGDASQEFHVLAHSGEDNIAFCNHSNYATNVELAEALMPAVPRPDPVGTMVKVHTPNQNTIDKVCKFLQQTPQQSLKSLVVLGQADDQGKQALIMLVLRGDHMLNTIKAEKHPLLASPLTMAPVERITQELHTTPGSIGPTGTPITVIADRAATVLANFTCGANQSDYHYTQVNWDRDATYDEVADLRDVTEGDPSPCGKGNLTIRRGIEVGHIFQLGDKYSRAMKATVLDEKGQAQPVQMGCYGVGITRIVAAAVEQNHDHKGIIWPAVLAPFTLVLIPLNYDKSNAVKTCADQLYHDLVEAGIDVLLDDRPLRPGNKFADADLIGIPHQVIIGDRGIEAGVLEYRARTADNNQELPMHNATVLIQKKINNPAAA